MGCTGLHRAAQGCTCAQVKEKVKISDHANSGCYCFSSGAELEKQCLSLLDSGSTQLSQDKVHAQMCTHACMHAYVAGRGQATEHALGRVTSALASCAVPCLVSHRSVIPYDHQRKGVAIVHLNIAS